MSEPRRESETTDHGVTLYPPTAKRLYFRIVYHDANHERRQESAGRSYEPALARAWAIDDELAGATADPTGRSVDELLDDWLPERRKTAARRTYAEDERNADLFIRPRLGAASAWTLGRDEVKACWLAAPDNSARRHLKSALSAMITWGHAEGWVADPAPVFFPPQPRTALRDQGKLHGEAALFIDEHLRPAPEDCRVLAEALAGVARRKRRQTAGRMAEQLWLMVAAASSCGMRQGEEFAAPVGALRPASARWWIDRQVVRVKGHPGGLVTPPKWGKNRLALLPEFTIWGEPFRDRLLEFAAGRPADALLFPPAGGDGFFHPSNFGRDQLTAARLKAGGLWRPPKDRPDDGTHGWTWHSLRHAFCTALLSAGVADTDVAVLAGHRDSRTTRAMYVGATAGVHDRADAALRPKPAEGDAA